MLARKLLAGALVFGLAASNLANFSLAQEEKEQEENKFEKKATVKWVKKADSWVQKTDSDEKIDDELQKRVMGQLKKSLKKFEKELGEKKMASIMKSVERSLSGQMNDFKFEFKGVGAAEIHRQMADQLSKLDHSLIKPHMIQLNGGDRKMIGVLLKQIEGKNVEIEEVLKESAAEKAGIKAGDVIIKVNGQKVGDPESLSKNVQSSKGLVKIEVKRDGKSKVFKVEPKKMAVKGLTQNIFKFESGKPMIMRGKDGESFEIHKDVIRVAPKGAEGKPHGIILLDKGDGKKRIELKIDRAAEDKKLIRKATDGAKQQIRKRIEIRSDLNETIEKLQKQMKEMQAEIKKLKNSKN